jgi:hypothetical protein
MAHKDGSMTEGYVISRAETSERVLISKDHPAKSLRMR